eukprot:6182093-Pleurochrysis_carterae.AAC.3
MPGGSESVAASAKTEMTCRAAAESSLASSGRSAAENCAPPEVTLSFSWRRSCSSVLESERSRQLHRCAKELSLWDHDDTQRCEEERAEPPRPNAESSLLGYCHQQVEVVSERAPDA